MACATSCRHQPPERPAAAGFGRDTPKPARLGRARSSRSRSTDSSARAKRQSLPSGLHAGRRTSARGEATGNVRSSRKPAGGKWANPSTPPSAVPGRTASPGYAGSFDLLEQRLSRSTGGNARTLSKASLAGGSAHGCRYGANQIACLIFYSGLGGCPIQSKMPQDGLQEEAVLSQRVKVPKGGLACRSLPSGTRCI